jgi:hypothetical protein
VHLRFVPELTPFLSPSWLRQYRRARTVGADEAVGVTRRRVEERTMDTIFLLTATLIILVALDFGEAGARAARPTRRRQSPA